MRRCALVAALALGASACAAVGAELVTTDPAALAASAAPGLLGPITEAGRTGWECAPERAATARTPGAAGLPRE